MPLIPISISVDVAEVPSQCPYTDCQIGGIVSVTPIGILHSTHSSRGLSLIIVSAIVVHVHSKSLSCLIADLCSKYLLPFHYNHI
jgi:hypothetical protein